MPFAGMASADGRMTVLAKTEPAPGMTLTERSVPEPGTGEVRLRVKSVGIDGGVEALLYRWTEEYHRYEPHLPQVFGHEFAGEIDAVGPGVEGWGAGDRVAVEPRLSCGDCRNCREGVPNLCTGLTGFAPHGFKSIGIDTDLPGALAEYVVVPARNLHALPEGVSYDEGAFLELLAIAVQAIDTSAFSVGDRVAVTGPGSVGLSAVIAAVEAGASEVVMIGADVDAETRLPIAERMGATETRTVDEGDLDDPVDVFIEASGHESALRLAERNTRYGGQIAQIGVYHGAERVPVDLTGLLNAGVSIQTVNGRREADWRRALAMAPHVDLDPVVGPSFGMEDYEAAFAAERNREGVKVLLNP